MKTVAASLLVMLSLAFAWAACGGNGGKGAATPDPMQQSDGGGALPEVPPVPSQ